MKNRIVLLEKIQILIDLTQTYIGFVNSDILSLIRTLTENSNLSDLSFLNDCMSTVIETEDFSCAWNKSVNDFRSSLTKEDKDILISFGSQLGKSDTQGQISNCELHKQRINSQIYKAEEIYKKHGNLYFNLCIISGILLDLVLL